MQEIAHPIKYSVALFLTQISASANIASIRDPAKKESTMEKKMADTTVNITICPAALFQMGIVTILCDLTQPHPDVAIPPKAVNAAKRTEEGFAGNILCQPFVPAGQPPDIEEHIPKILLVYLFKVRHLLTSLSRSLIRLRKTKNLTKKFVKNFGSTTYLPILQDCRSAVFAVGRQIRLCSKRTIYNLYIRLQLYFSQVLELSFSPKYRSPFATASSSIA